MILFMIFVVLQVGDAATTCHIIETGIGREANPIMRWLIGRAGLVVSFVSVKSALIWIAWNYWIQHPMLLAAMCLGYVAVLINNIRVIYRWY